VRTEFVFERNAIFTSQFSRWTKAHFVPKRPIKVS
jgi:hypothetical protein